MKAKPYVVLVGMDFSELADRALQQAFELAAQRESAEVHVVCVIPGPTTEGHSALTGYWLTAEDSVRDGAFESLRTHVQAELDRFVEHAALGGDAARRVVSHVRVDPPALGIAKLASELAADLIVLGAHGQHGPTRLLMGSVAESTVRHAACPVLVVPFGNPQRMRTSDPPWASISPAPRSVTHRPSVRP